MVITPGEPWSSTGEFALTLDAAPDDSVLFWEDVCTPSSMTSAWPGCR